MNALLKDAQIKLSKEVCVLGTGQRGNYAAVKDAQIMPRREGSAGDTEQKPMPNYAAAKDARIKSDGEEFAGSMGQRSNYAAVKDARIKLSKEEYVLGTGPIACEDS